MTGIGHRLLAATASALLVLAIAACSSESTDAGSTTTLGPTTTAPPDTSPQDTTPPVSGVVIELTIADDAVEGGVARHEVRVDETVVIRVTSDEEEELHVHGYDLLLDLAPGEPAELTFTADIPGVFEVELEGSGLKVAELQVG